MADGLGFQPDSENMVQRTSKSKSIQKMYDQLATCLPLYLLGNGFLRHGEF